MSSKIVDPACKIQLPFSMNIEYDSRKREKWLTGSAFMESWTSEAIIAAIHAEGITLAELARRNGLGAAAVSAAIQKPYEAGERAISTFLKVPARALWPLRYNSDGTRKRPQPTSNYRPRRRFVLGRRG